MLYILLSIIIFVIIIDIILIYLYMSIKHKYEAMNREDLKDRNKVRMIEYYFRYFKEGENPYTVLRKIGSIIKNEPID